jgi:hypothetical protein
LTPQLILSLHCYRLKMSSIKDRLAKDSRLFLRPSGSHNIQPEQLLDANKVAGFCRQETVTSLKHRKIFETVMKVQAQRNVAQEMGAPAVPKLVADLDEFRKKVENRTTKMAKYRKYHPSTSVWKNKIIKPVRENYEQQSRDRQFVANERKTSAEHRHDQLSFSDAEEGARSRAVSSDARAKKSKKKQQRSASEEVQKENKRRKVSAPEKKSRADNSSAPKKNIEDKKDETIKSLQDSVATLNARLSLMEAQQKAETCKQRERRRTVSESDDNRKSAQREQKKQKKSSEKRRSEKKRRREDTDESTDSEPETDDPRKKSSETRAKLRDKTTISPEKMRRKEKLEELKMKRRKSIERRQSQQDEESSSEEEQPAEKVAPLKKPPTLQLESSSEEDQPAEKIAPLKRPPSVQSESSSESELESEVEEECEMSDTGAMVASNAPPEELVENIQFPPRSPEESKPILNNILATLNPSRIPTLIDDERHDAVANQLMKIEGASSASQTACKEAAVNNLDAVAPRVLTSVKGEDIEVVILEDEPEIEDRAQDIVPETENHPEEVVPETRGNTESVTQMDKKDHALKLDKLIKNYQQYLHVEYENATMLTHKYRRKILKFDETLPLGSSIPAYKMSMLLAHLQDNIETKHT